MSPKSTLFFAAPASLMLMGCLSTAEGILDGVAGGVADIGSRSIIDADEKGCDDPRLLAEKAVRWEIDEARAFKTASSQCSNKFNVTLDQVEFSGLYMAELNAQCLPDRASGSVGSFCDTSPAFAKAKRDYQARRERAQNTATPPRIPRLPSDPQSLAALECDHEMFRRKANVAGEADAITPRDTGVCAERSCVTRETRWLFDGQRGSAEDAKQNWASPPASVNGNPGGWVELRWPYPYEGVEQVTLFANRLSQPANYRISVLTEGGWRLLADQTGNEELLICHRFAPQTVSAIRVWGQDVQREDQLRLTEIVVR